MAIATRVSARGEVSPPLPNAAPTPPQGVSPDGPAFGCYRISYTTSGASPAHYGGTLRVEAATGHTLASGDLYLRPDKGDASYGVVGEPKDPAIPIFPLNDYRYYLRVLQLVPAGGGFRLEFEMWLYKPVVITQPGGTLLTLVTWATEGKFSAALTPQSGAPAGRLGGDVLNSEGATVGVLSLTFVAKYLRKATIEFVRVPGLQVPLDSGMGHDWRNVFERVGWHVTPFYGNYDLAEPSGESWSGAEAHEAMLTAREKSDLDTEWRFHVLCVRHINLVETSHQGMTEAQIANGDRGYMFDQSATDTNNLPREGVMVAANWVVPNEPKWGRLQGMRAAETLTYFRTAMHEIGHAMGLIHNEFDTGFMNPTNIIADEGAKPGATPFPDNIRWSFQVDDELRLRHWPDMIVRPGGKAWGGGASAPTSTSNEAASDVLRLDVLPVLPEVPFGAPVRADLNLVNKTEDRFVLAPDSISLMSGAVRGRVTDSSGNVRTFAPLVVDEDDEGFTPLEPGQSVNGSLTLLRGREGALFPLAGEYRITVEVRWQEDLTDMVVTGEARITVTAPADAAHEQAARKVLESPDALITLALGGDHLKEGVAALGAALNNDVLRPHFAYVEAKRLAMRFGSRAPDLQAAAALIDDTTVMSPAELRKVARLAQGDAPGTGAMAAKVRARMARGGESGGGKG